MRSIGSSDLGFDYRRGVTCVDGGLSDLAQPAPAPFPWRSPSRAAHGAMQQAIELFALARAAATAALKRSGNQHHMAIDLALTQIEQRPPRVREPLFTRGQTHPAAWTPTCSTG